MSTSVRLWLRRAVEKEQQATLFAAIRGIPAAERTDEALLVLAAVHAVRTAGLSLDETELPHLVHCWLSHVTQKVEVLRRVQALALADPRAELAAPEAILRMAGASTLDQPYSPEGRLP